MLNSFFFLFASSYQPAGSDPVHNDSPLSLCMIIWKGIYPFVGLVAVTIVAAGLYYIKKWTDSRYESPYPTQGPTDWINICWH